MERSLVVPAMFLLAVIFAVADGVPEASVPYFSNKRDVTPSAADRTNYFVIDEEIWSHTRPDLADLRLLGSDNHEVPYVLISKGSSRQKEELPAKIQDLGRSGDQ